jgi:hypothetical protein
MSEDERPLKPLATPSIAGAMPLPAMYEILRANLDFVGAVNAARQVRADDRATENCPED